MKQFVKSFLSFFTVLHENIFNHNHLSIYSRYWKNFFGKKIMIQEKCNITNTKIGDYSYIGRGSYVTNMSIGKFCSIAPGFTCAFGRHPSKIFVSTHPFFYSKIWNKNLDSTFFEEFKYIDKEKNIMSKIGNDVWIGTNVIILDGIEIGDGAIIGAGTIVTKNVPDYAIVAGNPGKIIGYRFEEKEIEFLKEKQWWNRDLNIFGNDLIHFRDINDFINYFKNGGV